MTSMNCYLSGPIAGLTYDQVVSWRELLRTKVDSSINLISPMRGKQHLSDVEIFHQVIADNKSGHNVMDNGKAIFSRDYFDVQNCDVLLFNALGATEKSIGSICEVAWAFQMRKPIVFAIDNNKDNPHNHDFLHTMANYTVDNIEDAAYVVNSIFTGYRWR